MDNAVRWVAGHKALFTSVAIGLHLIGTILGGWFCFIPVCVLLVLVLCIKFGLFRPVDSTADRYYWTVPKSLLDSLMPAFELKMATMGYRREDYRPEAHDCDDYAVAGVVVLHGLLKEHRPDGRADPLFQFSFMREDGRRHRLFFVVTDGGRVYIDNWRINGSMYRKLSLAEEANGKVII